MTNDERNLLKRMASGALDGSVGDDLTTSCGSSVWKVIKDGVPAMFKQGLAVDFLMVKRMSISKVCFILYRNGLLMNRSLSS